MKKLIIWLAKIFNVNLTVEKVIYKDKIVEVIKEVPKEVIKEVIVEVPVEVIVEKEVIKYIPNPDCSDVTKYDGVVESDFTVKGNLLVTGVLNTTGEIACFKE